MCGICGIKGIPSGTSHDDCQRMLSSLAHRGPDAQGLYSGLDNGVFLGAARLSIVDVTPTGSQPIFNEDKSLVLVCNGEIYNAPALRRELVRKSHRFSSSTDIEVIIHLYEEMGERCLEKLKGMFAFALWDDRKKSLFVARDRLGIKPLYYYSHQGVFAFASELKSILTLPFIRRELNPDAVDLYFSLEYVPAPFSMYQGILKLMPGAYLIYRGSQLQEGRYWDLGACQSGSRKIGFSQAADRLEALIDTSVKEHLMADVPVGIFLSGGLDSTALAAFAMRHLPEKASTFSIGFDEKSFDETLSARTAARFLGTRHFHRSFTVHDFIDVFPLITGHLDEPLGDLSVFPTYFLSRFAREHVKAVLSGEGGDELFMGYPTYKAHKFLEDFRFIPPAWIRHSLRFSATMLPVGGGYMTPGFRVRQFLRGEHAGADACLRHFNWMGSFLAEEKKSFYSREFKGRINGAALRKYADRLEGGCSHNGVLKKIQSLDIQSYLADDLLVKADRASMAASLEVRVPYLDHELMEFVRDLPADYIFQKRLFKSVVKKFVPRATIQKKKKGFAIPFTQWLQDARVQPLVEGFFNEDFINNQGLFDASYIKRMLAEHQGFKHDNRKKLGTYIMFQAWYQEGQR